MSERTASPSVSFWLRLLLTAVMLNEAFAEARAKDSDREQGIELKGAFWGLPCSFKGEYCGVFMKSKPKARPR
jgi:hypothetical protein